MSRQQLTPIEKMFRKARRAYRAVFVLTGLVAIVLAIIEELSNVARRRAAREELPQDEKDREEIIVDSEAREEEII